MLIKGVFNRKYLKIKYLKFHFSGLNKNNLHSGIILMTNWGIYYFCHEYSGILCKLHIPTAGI